MALAPVIMAVGSGMSLARDLTFAERVNCQEAIERVYYSHQLAATKRFEEAVPNRLLVEKVQKSLRESVALERFWKTPLTDAALRKELERVAAGTRFPERLQEIYAALGQDSFLVKECYVRPLLADRLVHDFFARDARIHGARRRDAEELRDRLLRGEIDVAAARPDRVEMQIVREADGRGDAEAGARGIAPRQRGHDRLELSPASFLRFRADCPRLPHEIGEVHEEDDAFGVRVLLGETDDALRVVSFVVRKRSWDDWWSDTGHAFPEGDAGIVASTVTPLPFPSTAHAVDPAACGGQGAWDNGILDEALDYMLSPVSVWTGSEMLIWGTISDLATGRRYDPLTDTWGHISGRNAPPGDRATAVWTGTEMIVWGGSVFSVSTTHPATNRGGRYDPLTDRWEPTTTVGAPEGRIEHTAVWTGSRMIVWGGWSNTGGQYDPVTDRWSPTSLIGAPSARAFHTAVWTGEKMIVWGGITGSDLAVNSGAQYDPQADSWSPTTLLGAPVGRGRHTAVWTGSAMVVWGGYYYGPIGTREPNEVSLYDPRGDSWQIRPVAQGPYGRYGHLAVWTGSAMLIFAGAPGGWKYNVDDNTWTRLTTIGEPVAISTGVWTGSQFVVFGRGVGGRYAPDGDTWTPLARTVNAPIERYHHTAVWTGNLMIIFGGVWAHGLLGDGWKYDPVSDTWSMLSIPHGGYYPASHSAVWTGSQMIVWGGAYGYPTVLNKGLRYDPIGDAWTPTSTVNAPSPRVSHTAVWTGSAMIVWGGEINVSSNIDTNTGGRYDPETDTWSSTSLAGAPSPRSYHTAVWTGRVMSVWGGYSIPHYPNSIFYDDGANYDPATDSWQPISNVGAPAASPYIGQSAVWTGTRMIIWGSELGTSGHTGGMYDPATDSWTGVSVLNAPTKVTEHLAVWTGRYMLVWGGRYARDVNTGGQYDPEHDRWTQITTENAPPPMEGRSAVWTGTDMIVWSGRMGGRYTPDDSADGDGDGYRACGGDCNDGDGGVFPGAVESCDGADQNCDGRIDEEFQVGTSCSADIDACHVLQGERQCRADHAGSECVGAPILHDVVEPTISCPADRTIECPGQASDLGRAVASDACDTEPRVASNATPVLPLGTSLIEWTATDSAGNDATCLQSVTIRDSTPPVITVSAAPAFLWPPNHRMADVHATVAALDACGPASVQLSSIAATEADDAPGPGDGRTPGDVSEAQFGTADFDFQLRAERDAGGPGRAYEVVYSAVDGSGNRSGARSLVFVPHDLAGGTEPLIISLASHSDGTSLTWEPVPRAISYRVIRGTLGGIRETDEWVELGTVSCIQPDSSATSTASHLDAEAPSPGQAFFYLVAYNDGQDSGYGTNTAMKPLLSSGGECEAN